MKSILSFLTIFFLVLNIASSQRSQPCFATLKKVDGLLMSVQEKTDTVKKILTDSAQLQNRVWLNYRNRSGLTLVSVSKKLEQNSHTSDSIAVLVDSKNVTQLNYNGYKIYGTIHATETDSISETFFFLTDDGYFLELNFYKPSITSTESVANTPGLSKSFLGAYTAQLRNCENRRRSK